MKASSIVPPIVLSLTLAAAVGCSATARKKAFVAQRTIEAGLEAKLEVLSEDQNLQRIESITHALLNAEATHELARSLAAGAVLGLSEPAQEKALQAAAAALVDSFLAALSDDGGQRLDALLRDAGGATARGVLDNSVLERADPFAQRLSQTVANALLEQTASELPAILDASLQRVSPRLGETIEADLGPALANSITEQLAPALAAALETSLGPAFEALLEGRLLPALDRTASERLPPLVRTSTREAMLGVGDALDGELGEQAQAFVYSLVDGSKQRLSAKLGTSHWVLGAAVAALLAATFVGVYLWRRARAHRRLRRAREGALFFLTNTINRLPAELQRPIKSAVAEAGRARGGDGGSAELESFLGQYSL